MPDYSLSRMISKEQDNMDAIVSNRAKLRLMATPPLLIAVES